MRTRTQVFGGVLTTLALALSLPLTVLAGEVEARTGGVEAGTVRSVEPAGESVPQPVTDRPGPANPDRARPAPSDDRCLSLAEDRRRCLETEPTRERCLELAENPRRCLHRQPSVDRCSELADNPRRCVQPPAQHNFRQLLWRLIHAGEWKLLIRLLHALGLV